MPAMHALLPVFDAEIREVCGKYMHNPVMAKIARGGDVEPRQLRDATRIEILWAIRRNGSVPDELSNLAQWAQSL